MRKWFSLAAAAVSATVLAGCGSGGDGAAADGDAAPVTLTFVSYNYGTPDLGGQGTQQLIDEFQKAHPTITIEAEGVAVKDALTKVRTATAAGNPPDIAQIGWSKMAEAYQSLPIVPIQSIPSAEEWKAHTEGISKNILEATAHDGETVAMPYAVSTPTLFYNADLFRAAGLDPADPPETMAEVKADALAIVGAGAGAEGVYFGAADPGKSDFLTQSLVDSNGGSLVSPDGKVTLDQPEAVEALATVQDLTTSGAQPAVGVQDAMAAFNSGKLGMLLTSTAVLAGLDTAAKGKFELLTAGFPRFGDQPARPTYSGAGLVVLSEDKAKQQAAWEFVKFMTGEEGGTITTKTIGYLPIRPALADDPKYLAGFFAEDDRLLPAMKQLETVTPYTSFPGEHANEAVVTLQDKAVEPIILRGADPETTLAAVADEIRSLVGE